MDRYCFCWNERMKSWQQQWILVCRCKCGCRRLSSQQQQLPSDPILDKMAINSTSSLSYPSSAMHAAKLPMYTHSALSVYIVVYIPTSFLWMLIDRQSRSCIIYNTEHMHCGFWNVSDSFNAVILGNTHITHTPHTWYIRYNTDCLSDVPHVQNWTIFCRLFTPGWHWQQQQNLTNANGETLRQDIVVTEPLEHCRRHILAGLYCNSTAQIETVFT